VSRGEEGEASVFSLLFFFLVDWKFAIRLYKLSWTRFLQDDDDAVFTVLCVCRERKRERDGVGGER